MKTTAWGSQGLEASVEGLGAMGMSAFYGDRDDTESTATLNRALDLGVSMIDTAEIYGPFLNEQLIGQAIGHRRDEFALATKFATPHRGRRHDRPARRQPGVCPQGARALAQAPRHGDDRPLLPAPRRPERPDRGDRRRDGGVRHRGQGPLPGPVRGGARDDPPRPRDASDHGGADGVLAVRAQPRGQRRARHDPRARHRVRRVLTAGSWRADRRDLVADRPGRGRLAAQHAAVRRARP